MTSPSREDAVRAVAEALADEFDANEGITATEAAEAAVTAAEPIIRAAVAAEIRSRADEDGQWIGPTDPDSILRMAARIAEGTP